MYVVQLRANYRQLSRDRLAQAIKFDERLKSAKEAPRSRDYDRFMTHLFHVPEALPWP